MIVKIIIFAVGVDIGYFIGALMALQKRETEEK